MTGPEYQSALRVRGFHFNETVDRWIGPFNIMVSSFLNYDVIPTAASARIESLAVVDEQLRASREGSRPRSSGGPGPGLL